MKDDLRRIRKQTDILHIFIILVITSQGVLSGVEMDISDSLWAISFLVAMALIEGYKNQIKRMEDYYEHKLS